MITRCCFHCCLLPWSDATESADITCTYLTHMELRDSHTVIDVTKVVAHRILMARNRLNITVFVPHINFTIKYDVLIIWSGLLFEPPCTQYIVAAFISLALSNQTHALTFDTHEYRHSLHVDRNYSILRGGSRNLRRGRAVPCFLPFPSSPRSLPFSFYIPFP